MKRFVCLALTVVLLLGTIGIAEEYVLQNYNKKTKTLTYVTFGKFPTNADGSEEPIVWRVLNTDGQMVYLMSEYILEAHQIHPSSPTETYVGWKNSNLYAYLNGDFMNTAFTKAEQSTLIEITEDSSMVSLPSATDLKNADYGFINEKSRQAQSTAYAKANGLFVYQGKNQYSPYWLRTLSKNHPTYAHMKLQDDGKIGFICVEVADVGIRPVIQVSQSLLSIASGEGTLASPYVLTAMGAEAEEVEETDSEAVAESEQIDEAANESAEQTEEAEAVELAEDGAFDELFEGLTAEGFLPSGAEEFVYQDADTGVWLYASDTLRIEIHRREDTSKKNRPLRWLEADIYVNNGADFMKVYYNAKDNPKKEAEVIEIARKNQLVFAINADWYYYRVKRNAKKRTMSVGVILREGEILYDDPAKKASTSIPNRDILALFEDGDLRVYDYNGITAEQLKADGAYDVLSFGPVLLRDGEITEQTKNISAHQSNNPRMGIGLVEKGHYVAIMAEGRIKGSKGCTLSEFAQMFLDKGCVSAYNLDGGGTATMMFMGEYINQLGSYTADKRLQTEVVGIGISDAITQ